MDIDWKGIDRTHRALGGEGTTVLLLRTKERDLAVLEGALEGVSADSPAKAVGFRSVRDGVCSSKVSRRRSVRSSELSPRAWLLVGSRER